jgi:NitT/TauT family transport system substrate-binding protein
MRRIINTSKTPARRAIVTRRSVLAAAAAALVAPAIRPALAAERETITVWGPPAAPSIAMFHAIATGGLRALTDRAQFKIWRNPDELRAGLASKTMELIVLPTQVAANLFNRGLGVHLATVLTNGLVYIVSEDPSIAAIEDLKGRSIAIPFRNDMPDLLFRRLLAGSGLSADTDVTLQYAGTPMEAMQLLLVGRVDAALVPEPSASTAVLRAPIAGKTVSRVIDVQAAWGRMTGQPPVLPQAGLGVTTAFLDRHPGVVDSLHDQLVSAVAAVNAEPARAADVAAAALDLPPPVLAQSIPWSNLVAIRARDARASVESMLQTLAAFDRKIIGGALPESGFYL